MNIQELINALNDGRLNDTFSQLYGLSDKEIIRQKARYLNAAEKFSRLFPEQDEIHLYSAPGRSEVGGNHTDHQHGCVFAAAVNCDVIAFVSFNDSGIIHICSEGHDPDIVDISELEPVKDEEGHSVSLVRGIAAKFAEMGVKLSGFDAYTTSEVKSGSGLSSSAAFENLVGNIIDRQFNGGKAGAVEIAKIGQFAENVYFGKASGLMDQMVSSVGGFVAIDFKDPAKPVIEAVDFDFSAAGYSLCITDTKGSHTDLTPDYSAVPAEMKKVAEYLGCDFLRDADEDEFYAAIPELRKICSDRAILRAAHFFGENQRAVLEAEALKNGDTEEFFSLVNESGQSSYELLQNLYSPLKYENQEMPLAIMLSKRILAGNGAVRVHGGGFAGTIQAFVPTYLTPDYSAEMDRIFGEGSCHILSIRPVGGIEIIV